MSGIPIFRPAIVVNSFRQSISRHLSHFLLSNSLFSSPDPHQALKKLFKHPQKHELRQVNFIPFNYILMMSMTEMKIRFMRDETLAFVVLISTLQ